MEIRINLKETDDEIIAMILNAMTNQLNSAINKAIPKIEKRIKALLVDLISNCPEVNAMTTGTFKSELGMVDIQERINKIIEVWADSLRVKKVDIKQSGSYLNGGIRITAIQSDYYDVMGLTEAEFLTPENSWLLRWLAWLLIDGTRVVVRGYNIRANPRKSRTGKYVMVEKSEGFRIPPQYAGTPNNNFVTRALDNIDDAIISIIKSEFKV